MIVNATYQASIAGIAGDIGCRHVVKQNPDQVFTVEMETDHVIRDIDTMEDYQKLVADTGFDLLAPPDSRTTSSNERSPFC